MSGKECKSNSSHIKDCCFYIGGEIMTKRKFALVFSGGGGKGAYQIGVWKALRKLNVEKDIAAVSGASVGALNSMLFLTRDLEKAEDIWSNISQEKILSLHPKTLLKNVTENTILNIDLQQVVLNTASIFNNGMFSRQGLEEIMNENIDFKRLSISGRRCFVSCVDIKDKTTKYFDMYRRTEEEMKKILLASSAIPLVYEPVIIDGRSYVDGGLIDNIPIEPLYKIGYRKFIIVDLDSIDRIEYEKYPESCFIRIALKDNPLELLKGTFDFSKEGAKRRLEQGYNDGIKKLKKFLELDQEEQKVLKGRYYYRKNREIINKLLDLITVYPMVTEYMKGEKKDT